MTKNISTDIKLLKHSLRKALVNYRKERPKLSVRAIARNSGVNRYFLNKLLDSSPNNEDPAIDLNQVLIFINFLNKNNNISDSDDSLSEIKKQLQSIFNPDDSLVFSNKNQQINLYDEKIFILTKLASCKKGVAKNLLKSMLGENIKIKINDLISNNVLIEVNDRLFLEKNIRIKFHQEILKQNFSAFKFFLENIESAEEDSLNLSVQSLNLEAIKKIKKAHNNYLNEISSLMNDPKNSGELTLFSISSLACLKNI